MSKPIEFLQDIEYLILEDSEGNQLLRITSDGVEIADESYDLRMKHVPYEEGSDVPLE